MSPSTSTDSTISPGVACGPGTYVVPGPGSVECRACANGSYSTASGVSECTTWTDCEPGEYVSVAGSAIRDRVCNQCPANESSTELNAPTCSPLGCPEGSAKDESGTCADCEAGSYCAGGDEPAVVCEDSSWDDDNDPATACAQKHTCGAGEHLDDDGSPTRDRTCAPCEPETYNAIDNAATCTSFSTCDEGSYLAAPGTSVVDNTCLDCEPGSFSNMINAEACTLWAECTAPDYRATNEPTTSTNRTCSPCTEPYVTRENNESQCRLYAYTTVYGEVVIEAEDFYASHPRDDVEWTLFEDVGLSGGASVQAGSDGGLTWMMDPTTTAPQLDYRVNFTAPGSYYVHVRGDAGTASNDTSNSCYIGIDGVTQQYNFDVAAGTWGWQSQNFLVDTAGVHVVSLYGREDGFRADKIVVSNAASAPTGAGPAATELDESVQRN